ncbi:MAG: protein kinase domain-containing protein [Planctomycetota bacterium]
MQVLCPKCGARTESLGTAATCVGCGHVFVAGDVPTNPDATVPTDPLIGVVIGGCRLTQRIGAGGMGVVYKAEQISLGRTVAIKLLPDSLKNDPQIAERFKREIAILAKLSHPTIVSILDGGISEQGAFFIMEFVDGVSLRRILNTGGLEPAHALQIVRQLCDALEYAHQNSIIHRDIKPENILINRDGRVRLLDFGLSRYTSAGEPGLLTRATQVLGTFEYMAPEQREASRSVDHRADLYSLGVVIYEMLTGELPIGKFDPPSKRNIQVDVRLDEVVLRVLEKSPDRRYQNASDIKTEVDRIVNAPPMQEPPTVTTQAPPVAAVPPFVPPAPSANIYNPAPPPITTISRVSLASNISLGLACVVLLSIVPVLLIPAMMEHGFVRGEVAGTLAPMFGTLAFITGGTAIGALIQISISKENLLGTYRAIFALAAAIMGVMIVFPVMFLIVK